MSAIVQQFEHSLALPFFGIGMKTDIFQSCGHCCISQIYWHIECSTFTASSFRIRNSSTGIPSLSLALFMVTLPKAHLTLHSRMSFCRWVITPVWLSGLKRSILYSSSVYSCHLFFFFFVFFLPPLLNIFCFCLVHTISALYWACLCMKCFLGISDFLEEISCLPHCIVFLCFFALITEEGFLISPFYPLELWIQMGISFLFSFAFHFSSFLIAQLVKNPPAMQETPVCFLGWEDLLEKG